MSSVFTAAVCNQCGGALNLETLRCDYCAIPHFIDVASAIPVIASELADDKYFEHRDRRVDAAILFAIQQQATAHQVKLGLSLSTKELWSAIHVIGYPEDQQPTEIGTIIAYLTGSPSYEVDHAGYGRRCVHLSWQADLLGEPGARYYRLSTDRPSPILVSGETNLARSEYLGETLEMMVNIILRRNQWLQEEQARQELLAQQPVRPNFLQRLFGTA